MAKQVIWSKRAQLDRKEILEYWINRNKSNLYSKKLDANFKDNLKLIGEFPHVGKQTDDGKARVKIVKDYLLFYEETEDTIVVLSIWDSRQNPTETLPKKI